MPVMSLTLKGLRGFSTEQTLEFAKPSGEVGSGLTILVGPNNGGKSTVLESLRALFGPVSQTFTQGMRNKAADDRVSIRIKLKSGETYYLETVPTGGSETARESNKRKQYEFYGLPSRRYFTPYFGNKGQGTRQQYIGINSLPNTRGAAIDQFSNRLFEAQGNPVFNEILAKVMNPSLSWMIDQSDQGQYYLQANNDNHFHNSDGLGEGIISLIFIVDALYDSKPDGMIVIDEPELSLHPAYQRRLARLFADYAKDRQIVYATHSPYFVDFTHILNGAEVARVHKRDGGSSISQLSRSTAAQLRGFLTDHHNPHTLGLEAREALFRDDGMVLVEGQEDVVYYPLVLDQLRKMDQIADRNVSALKEGFFGWGTGGADKTKKILALLNDLGFERVAAIFDKNKANLIPALRKEFPKYYFDSIKADDVRTKLEKSLHGLLDENHELRSECVAETKNLFEKVGKYILV